MTPAGTPFPLAGTWLLRTVTSTLPGPLPLPQEGTVKFTPLEDSILYEAETTLSSGRTVHAEVKFRFDGQFYPLRGSTMGDALAAKQVGARSFDWNVTRAGVPSAKVAAKVSGDGRRLIADWEVATPEGMMTYTTVSERQD
ncbi:MAG TPA: hypothetical protein VE959_20490 [Bryobacteraceae bacterium]|nr:hypothetical protein [Bryobacteraceae bacterium]